MLIIYTALMGEKEIIGNPLDQIQNIETDLEIAFVCFTDRENLKSDIWRFIKIDTNYLSPEKASRLPKILPHRYLSNFDFSMYIDNTIKLKRLPNSSDLVSQGDYTYKLFQHSGRQNLYDEAMAIVNLGYDSEDIISNQINFYSKFIDTKNVSPLSTCPVIIRSHNHSEVIRFSECWWIQFLQFSKRDQMSFDFCRIMNQLKVEYLWGSTTNSDLIKSHETLKTNRIFANFDYEKYKHVNNLDLENSQISAHYLDSNPNILDAIYYSRKKSSLEYLSQLKKSSLSGRIYPNRNIAYKLENILSDFRSPQIVKIGSITDGLDEEIFWNKKEISSFIEVIREYFSNSEIKIFDGINKSETLSIEKNIDADVTILINYNQDAIDTFFQLSHVIRPKSCLILLNYVCKKSNCDMINYFESAISLKLKKFELSFKNLTNEDMFIYEYIMLVF